MSTSPARLTANAANSQHSTGPQTQQGKVLSSQNACKHGLSAREVIIAPGEHEEFQQLLADFKAEIKPQGVIQQSLFDDLVAAAWNLRRARRMEAELCSGMEYRALLNADDLQNKLDRLARHKTRIERTFHRCLKELKVQQTNAFLQITLPRPIRESISPLASANEITKRTQYLDQHDPFGARILRKNLSEPRASATGASNSAEEFEDMPG
jgi:hypothetical protein